MRIARAHSMHFIVLAILISFLRVSLHHSLMERNLIGVHMIDHFLFFLQAPDREECARSPKPFSRAQGACGRKAPSSVKGLRRYTLVAAEFCSKSLGLAASYSLLI